MSQSLAKIYIHLIYSTKNRQPLITPDIRPELHTYLGGTVNALNCQSLQVGGTADHVHQLFILHKTRPLCDVVEEVKKESSKWMKTKGEALKAFYWQSGYGAFSVSQSAVPAVSDYIANQEEHHRTVSFQDEFRMFLRKYQIEFDERYVWD